MIHINIISVGKLKEKYLKDAIEEYSKRLSKYCKLNIIELQDESLPSKINESIAKEIKKKEGEKILEAIKEQPYVITLDLKGREISSEEFSERIQTIATRGFSEITFIIGGTLGLDDLVLQKSNELI